jgi:LDH2 family malate/lactate/ureidoglycolate dehydrogenase
MAKVGNATEGEHLSSGEPPPASAGAVAGFVRRVLEAAGLPARDAEVVADLMTQADLRGSDTHGVIRLPLYVKRLQAGGINPRPNIRVVQDRPAAALLDGDNGMGHLVMHYAARLAIDKARSAGVAWVGARMSNHAGPAALYAMMPAAQDMVGIYLAVGSNNHLPPWGARENLLGTNPIAIAIPAQAEPTVLLDMAPTVAAFGKVRLKALRNEKMPVGWMIDTEGKPLTDAKRADTGFLLPIGDYKGSGLSLVIGLLAGVLNGAAFGREVVDFVKHPDRATNTGQAILALSIEAFAPVAEFKQHIDAAVQTMRNAQRLPGVERIWLPGEQSARKREERTKHGIPVPKSLRESLDAAARSVGVAPL